MASDGDHFDTEIHVGIDVTGDPFVLVRIADGDPVPFAANDAEHLGAAIICAAASGKARAELFRTLTMVKGWSPEQALEALPRE